MPVPRLYTSLIRKDGRIPWPDEDGRSVKVDSRWGVHGTLGDGHDPPKAVHDICCTFVTAVTKHAVCVCVYVCVSCADATSRDKADIVGCGM